MSQYESPYHLREMDGPQSNHRLPQQQQPVNFQPRNSAGELYPSRRVTIGGGAHESMNWSMDDFFARRPSMDMDHMDPFLRRGSMDSTSAMLDAAIFDLQRRRYSSMAALPNETPDAASFAPPQTKIDPTTLAARQQQLQQQQRELERRQRELEIQRQQLIASMQERQMPPVYERNASMGLGIMPRGSFPAGGSLGLGSVASHGSIEPHHPAFPPPQRGSGVTAGGNANSNSSSTNSQWWICQVCNAKAFASRQEAMQHENVCQAANNRNRLDFGQMPLTSYSELSAYTQQSTGMGYSARSDSMGMDSWRTNQSIGSYVPQMSNGPFAAMPRPMPLAMKSDQEWLTPLHCFVRQFCVEVFTASEKDVSAPSKGKRKPIQVGQVGIRCPHCNSNDTPASRERGSVYYPTTIASIYNATMNLLQRHLHACPAMPDDLMRRYETLKADDARSGTSKRYWTESALALGLVDTPNGIRFSALPPPSIQSLQQASKRNEAEHSNETAEELQDQGDAVQQDGMVPGEPLVGPEDKPYATEFSYQLLQQMQPCIFTEADRLGKRKGLPQGYPGLACRHCFGGYGSGRFFPSSIKTLSDTSKTLNVLHNHMMRCRKCPAEIRESLEKLRGSHDDERSKMKFGSQKAFFGRVWDRLHGKDAPPSLKRQLMDSSERSVKRPRMDA